MKLFQTIKGLVGGLPGFVKKQAVEGARETLIHSWFKDSGRVDRIVENTFSNNDRAQLFDAIAKLPNEDAKRSILASHARAVEENKTKPGVENRWVRCVDALRKMAASKPSEPSVLEAFGQLPPDVQGQILTLIDNDRAQQAFRLLKQAFQWVVREAHELDRKLAPLAADIHTRADNALREVGLML